MNYFMPTRVIMGENCVMEHAALFATLGQKALIVTGRHSAKANGALRDVTTALTRVGVTSVVFDSVMSNPTVDCVYKGAGIARTAEVDFVIAIGGGSPMDAAKAIALLAVQAIPKEQIFAGGFEPYALPMIHIPTTAGTGSEVTPYAILTNDNMETKTSISSPALFPQVALCDAKYMKELSYVNTVNTTMDALSHAVEGMMSVRANDISNALARDSIHHLMRCKDALTTGEFSIKDREELLYASTLAGMVIAQTGTTVVHGMGYSLTYYHNIDHGRANGILLADFMSVVSRQKPELVHDILDAMDMKSASEFRDYLSGLLRKRETLTIAQCEKYASKAAANKNVRNCQVIVTEAELLEVITSACNIAK